MDLARKPSAEVKGSFRARRDNATDVLETAIKNFEATLTPQDRDDLHKNKTIPPPDAVMVFTAELDAVNTTRKGYSAATTMHGCLQSVRDFTAVIDTYVSSNPEIAALVWGSVKLSMTVRQNRCQRMRWH